MRLVGIGFHGTRRANKHVLDVGGYCVGPPRTQILVKRPGSFKHTPHVAYTRHIPCAHILIKRIRSIKHAVHGRDAGRIQVGQGSIKGSGAFEHGIHVRHFGRIPLFDILIETLRMSKHGGHGHGMTGIPLANILVESNLVRKQPRKVGHFGDAPISNRIRIAQDRATRHVVDNIVAKFGAARITISSFGCRR